MMSWQWIAWFAVWVTLAVGGFAWLEWRAFKYPNKEYTLSRSVWILSTKFPLSIAVFNLFLGYLIGALSVHFLWHWCPDLMPLGTGG